MEMPNHVFHGYAVGFGARIEKPFWRQVTEASTALSPVGGRASVVVRDFQLEDAFAFEEARSSVLGHYYYRDKTNVTAETRVSSSVTGLVIPGVLRVDRVGMALVSEKDFPSGNRRFRIDEARIEGLRLIDRERGKIAAVNFDILSDAPERMRNLCARGTTTTDLKTAIQEDGEKGAQSHFWSAARNVLTAWGHLKESESGITVKKGDTTYLIYLGELFIRDDQVDLNMFRVEMSSNPAGGGGSGGSGGVNGSPSV